MPEQSSLCIICGRVRELGITVCGHFICQQCEQQIVAAKADDPDYPEMVRKLRQLWQAATPDLG